MTPRKMAEQALERHFGFPAVAADWEDVDDGRPGLGRVIEEAIRADRERLLENGPYREAAVERWLLDYQDGKITSGDCLIILRRLLEAQS